MLPLHHGRLRGPRRLTQNCGSMVLTLPGGTVRVPEPYVDDSDEVEVDTGPNLEHFGFHVRPPVVVGHPHEQNSVSHGDVRRCDFLLSTVGPEFARWLASLPASELPAIRPFASMLAACPVEGAHDGCTPGELAWVARAGFEPTTPRVGDGRSSAELPSHGRDGGTRTRDTGIMSAVLYRLSYTARSAGCSDEGDRLVSAPNHPARSPSFSCRCLRDIRPVPTPGFEPGCLSAARFECAMSATPSGGRGAR